MHDTKTAPDLSTLFTTFYDLSVSHNIFSKAEIRPIWRKREPRSYKLYDLITVHLAFQTLVGYFFVYQILISDRFKFTRDYLENLSSTSSSYLYGFCLLLLLPGMSLIQNFVVTLIMNLQTKMLSLKAVVKHLWEVSETNLTIYPDISVFTFHQTKSKNIQLLRIIASDISLCLLPIITCILLAYPHYEFTICSARVRF